MYFTIWVITLQLLLIQDMFDVNYPTYVAVIVDTGCFWSKCRHIYRRSYNFAKFTGEYLCQNFLSNKVAGLESATLLKETLWHRCFPVNFAKFLRTLNGHFRAIASIDTAKYSKLIVLRNFIGSLEIIRNTWQSYWDCGLQSSPA